MFDDLTLDADPEEVGEARVASASQITFVMSATSAHDFALRMAHVEPQIRKVCASINPSEELPTAVALSLTRDFRSAMKAKQ